MASSDNFGFGKFVPGFDFMQTLTKQATQTIPQLPNMANWIAPTLNVEELDKRLEELKQVQFWLNQNANALQAVIQALEVQKMTLATLKDMNFNLGDVANAFKLKAADTVLGGVSKAVGAAAGAAKAASKGENPLKAAKEGAESAGSLVPDAMQWWGGLTKQFAEIAGQAMQQAGQKTALDAAINTATELGKGSLKAGRAMADSFAKPRALSKTVATKSINTKTPGPKPLKKALATVKKAPAKPAPKAVGKTRRA